MILDDEPLPFWFDDGPAVGATAEVIVAAEEYIGCVLPDSLKSLLLERDGGGSNYLAYYVGDCYVSLPSFFGVRTIVSSFDSASEFGTPEGVLAIGSSAHSWIGLDYRKGAEPLVVYQEDEDANLVVVANSFKRFLEGLIEEL